MILGSISIVVALGLLGLSFFLANAAWFYVAFAVALDVLLFTADRARTPPEGLELSEFERQVFQQHAIYVRFPGGSTELCAALQATRWLSLLWLPCLLWWQMWWPAGILLVHFVLTAGISVRLNPVGPYLHAAQEGDRELGLQAAALQRMLGRLHHYEEHDADADSHDAIVPDDHRRRSRQL